MTDATEALEAALELGNGLVPAQRAAFRVAVPALLRLFLENLDGGITVAEILEQLEGERR